MGNRKLRNHSLIEYCHALSKGVSTPGGGSAAALSAALGVSLITMVAHYSLKKSPTKAVQSKIKKIIKTSDTYSKRLLELVDADAQAYQGVVSSRKKGKAALKKAQRDARKVPAEVCRICFYAVDMLPTLVKDGNKKLISDIEVALELLLSSYNSCLALIKE